MAKPLLTEIEPWKTYKLTTVTGTQIFVFSVYTSYCFVKYGRNDYVGKIPSYRLESEYIDRGGTLEEWPMSDDVFNDYYLNIIYDVFKNVEYYAGKRKK